MGNNEEEIIHTQPKKQVSLLFFFFLFFPSFLSGCFWVAQTRRGKKKTKQPADETKGEGEKTRPPSGQDQSDRPNGAQRWNMASPSAESKSDPESLQQQRRRRRQQRPSAVTSNMIHSPALFIAVCASMHVWAYTCVKQKKKKEKWKRA